MNAWRWTIVVLGPLPIVAASLGLARWVRPEQSKPPDANVAHVATDVEHIALRPTGHAAIGDESLEAACRERGQELQRLLEADCTVLVRPPFVLAGDLDRDALEAWHRQTIAPATRIMQRCYFDTRPSAPISVLLFREAASYDHYARQLFGDQEISVYGYYRPHLRTLVMNIGTGGGTLVHELTHALAAFDFPDMPDWFNEGLASLHEACRIRADETAIDPEANWRLPALRKAIEAGQLPSLQMLVREKNFRGADVALRYAQARYFCWFLQQRGVLEKFYRRFRADHRDDSTGERTLLSLFPEQSWSDIDRDFQLWAREVQ